MSATNVHASAVAVKGCGVLIRGPSGSGKSSLILQILSADPVGSVLIADDQVEISEAGGRVFAKTPDLLAGLLEIRGQGILRLPYMSPAVLNLVVDIAPAASCPRMPTGEQRRVCIAGVTLDRIFIAAGAGDGAARVRAALTWPVDQNSLEINR